MAHLLCRVRLLTRERLVVKLEEAASNKAKVVEQLAGVEPKIQEAKTAVEEAVEEAVVEKPAEEPAKEEEAKAST